MFRLFVILLLWFPIEAAAKEAGPAQIYSQLPRAKLPPNVTVPAIFVFGDSIMDTGNNNNLLTAAKCNFPPYGNQFPGHLATGRFSNGKVPSDFVAEVLGIKDTVPAYLSPNLNPQDLLSGVTFASGASGFDPLTASVADVLSFPDQLNFFKEYISKIKTFVGEEKSKFILNNAIFIVVSSSNDIATTFIARSSEFSPSSYTEFLANSASDFVKELYGLGARRIAVYSAVPVGCVPAQRTLRGFGQCVGAANEMAIQFNSQISSKLDFLTKSLEDSRIVLVDVYDELHDMIHNPTKYGFEVSDKGCCGTGTLEVAVLCNPYSLTCPNPSTHVFWDSYHPTEAAYRVIVNNTIFKYIDKFF